MKKQKIFYTELAYVFGMILLAIGTALMEKADFGMSMVVAPAYLIHRVVSQVLPWFSFGVAEYCFQAFLLLVLACVMRHFKKGYLFSFVTAVLYGVTLDAVIGIADRIPFSGMIARILYFFAGMMVCSIGVAFFFETYISPEAYELFVKELATKLPWPISRIKTVYDRISALIGVVMSFAFFGFGQFVGVKLGTVLCALVNGWIIGQCSSFLHTRFTFQDGLPLRQYFN